MPTDEKLKAPVTGAILSDPDYRDKIAAQAVYDGLTEELAAGTLPDEFLTELTALGEALHQNKIPACVSHAWVLVMMHWWWKKTGEIVHFSPRFLDILSSETWIPLDGGRVPRTVCKISAKIGCCTTKLLPNDTAGLTIAQYRNPAVITKAMLDEAAKYKIPGYIRIPDDTPDDFRVALLKLGLVSGLFRIGKEFWTPSWLAKDILPLRIPTSATEVSGHQMVVKGFKSKLNILQNSWGKLWGRNGDGEYDPKKWLYNIHEGWAIATIPADVKAFLSSLPPQDDFHYNWTKDMEFGQTREDIKFAQIAFMILGIMTPVPPEQLGIFGPKTAKANSVYQALKKIPVASRNPNRIGPLTRGFLNADFAL